MLIDGFDEARLRDEHAEWRDEMTNTQSQEPEGLLLVEQVDREAASKVRPHSYNSALILEGKRDGTDIVQAAAHARLSALTSQPNTEGWQPIDTAPRDGQEVDVWYASSISRPGLREANVHWNGHDGFWRRRDRTHCIYGEYPTHWRPLPAPPEAGA